MRFILYSVFPLNLTFEIFHEFAPLRCVKYTIRLSVRRCQGRDKFSLEFLKINFMHADIGLTIILKGLRYTESFDSGSTLYNKLFID